MSAVEGTNSYGSLADANIYFENSVSHLLWAAFTSTQKDQGLVTATRIFEKQSWSGTKTSDPQDLDFPRTGLTDCAGESVSSDESLTIIQEAQYEYSLALLTNPSLLNTRDATGTNIKKVEAGSAKVTFFRPQVGTLYPLSVTELISCFFLGSGVGSITGSFASGTSSSSSFTNQDQNYGLNKGFS